MQQRYNVFKLRGSYYIVDQDSNTIVGGAHYGRGSAVEAMRERAIWDQQKAMASETIAPLLDQIDEMNKPKPVVEIVGRVAPSAVRNQTNRPQVQSR